MHNPQLAALTLRRFGIGPSEDPAPFFHLALDADATLCQLAPNDTHARERFGRERNDMLAIATALETLQACQPASDPLAARRQLDALLERRVSPSRVNATPCSR